ncbi:MAG: transcription-repair coupling factor [Bdellovibrionaceae bacterium]|nr:transcription-repair coupling factor [Bdellovibrionales bacterium]MCB9085476.1 transcription-repair coupling factor [Pseudobdellovibrionaceae bacterium]
MGTKTNPAEPWHPRLGTLVAHAWEKDSTRNLHVVGTTSYTLAAGMVADSIPWDGGKARLVVLPTDDDVVRFVEALTFFTPLHPVYVLPGFDVSPYDNLYPNPRVTAQRIKWLAAAQEARPGQIFVSSVMALLQRTLPFDDLSRRTLRIRKGQSLDSDFYKQLGLLGYQNVSVVDEVGGYALRGGILDIYSPFHIQPTRLELFGDEVESIRPFDPETQRSEDGDLSEMVLLPPREIVYDEDHLQDVIARYRATIRDREIDSSEIEMVLHSLTQRQFFPGVEFLLRCFYPQAVSPLDHFCCDLSVTTVDPLEVARHHDLTRESMKADYLGSPSAVIRPSVEDLYDSLEQAPWPGGTRRIDFSKIHLAEEWSSEEEDFANIIEYPAPDMAEFRKQAVALLNKPAEQIPYIREKITQLKEDGFAVFICTHSQSSASRINLLLEKCELDTEVFELIHLPWTTCQDAQSRNPNLVHLFVGPWPETVKSNPDKIVFLRDSDFWGHKKARRDYQTKGTLAQRANAVTFGDLKAGDFVVHKLHGVGIYEGLKIMDIQGVPTEMIHLRYKDNDSLYLPVYRIGQIQKYSGPASPKLMDKLGGTGWEKTKTKVRKHLRDMALDLLQLYAKRAQVERPPFSEADENFFSFENAFPYEETEDQNKVIGDVLSDMTGPQPMDRLLCGDVGFGKTEVAMRAAFKAVEDGRQVAVIAPTTVLTFQHTRTFRKRFAQWPVTVKSLNRFVPAKEIKQTLREMEEGKVDIVIGTHRLLSKDIKFKNLGLLIVDEEQKFGVKHKETLRKMKASVDTLALSATPIPRTLHMSLVGIRDLSLLNTPPLDRLPTRTFVCKFDKETIRKAVMAEIGRGGQVFFIHNRVQSIYALADELRVLLPDVRMAVAHGQMEEDQLEKTMIQFFNHELDVLICTTIIESGMDIPRANTMFVDRADHFGLSQLYQLRGRVGRSKERAYCYLLIPPNRRIDPDAQERLRVLQENTALGSGIRIAHYDLELRGAGDLLGQDQSGHINAIGYELYMELLDEAVRNAKGDPKQMEDLEPEINIRIPAFIPDRYISDIRVRLFYYKSMTEIRSPEDLERIEEELRDQFGKPPDEVLNLLGIMLIRRLCCDLGVKDLNAGAKRISLAFTDQTNLPVDKVIELTSRENKKFALTPDSRLIVRMNDITWPNVYEELVLLKRLLPTKH